MQKTLLKGLSLYAEMTLHRGWQHCMAGCEEESSCKQLVGGC